MKNNVLNILVVCIMTSVTACSQKAEPVAKDEVLGANVIVGPIKVEPHNYGGWYCPDNLNGFPAVDISDWKNVPVVNGRMATEAETRNGSSLILVDTEKYPSAKPLDIEMPKLATFYNGSTNREEIIIVIQAILVDNDSIVGFRYLNGGNGSARIRDVKFINEKEVDVNPKSRFVSQEIEINAGQSKIWEVLTNPANAKALQPTFDKNKKLKADWRKGTNMNYIYVNSGNASATYAEKLYGNFYIQNDYTLNGYSEKFILLEDKETNQTVLKIMSGPFVADYESQKHILNSWAKEVKVLSERM